MRPLKTDTQSNPEANGELSLRHLDRMTDSTGLIQHAIFCLPRRESGYTTDDNARALRLCTRLWMLNPEEPMLHRIVGYLSFLEHARNPTRGFHNLLSYQRDWLDNSGAGDWPGDWRGDWQGQAILALCEVLASSLPQGFRDLACELIETALPALADLRSLRAQAYLIQGWACLHQVNTPFHQRFAGLARDCADHLLYCHDRSQRPDWNWFESRLTYANAVLSHALFDADRLWPGKGYLEVAEATFAFLVQTTIVDGEFSPVGNRDWYSHGESKSIYDQQPLEAATMAAAARAHSQWRSNELHAGVFRKAYAWFHGANSQFQSLVDCSRGACFDGLQPHGINLNQGAESTLAFLWTTMLQREILHEFQDTPVASDWQLTH